MAVPIELLMARDGLPLSRVSLSTVLAEHDAHHALLRLPTYGLARVSQDECRILDQFAVDSDGIFPVSQEVDVRCLLVAGLATAYEDIHLGDRYLLLGRNYAKTHLIGVARRSFFSTKHYPISPIVMDYESSRSTMNFNIISVEEPVF